MKVYIAGPLFNDIERKRNLDITKGVESLGFSTYLPQRDGGVFTDMVGNGKTNEELRKNIFNTDIKAIHECDIILCLVDGRVPDEGMCIELGLAYALHKKCIAYTTDSRVRKGDDMNIIFEGALEHIFTNEIDLKNYLVSILEE